MDKTTKKILLENINVNKPNKTKNFLKRLSLNIQKQSKKLKHKNNLKFNKNHTSISIDQSFKNRIDFK